MRIGMLRVDGDGLAKLGFGGLSPAETGERRAEIVEEIGVPRLNCQQPLVAGDGVQVLAAREAIQRLAEQGFSLPAIRYFRGI